MNMYIYVYNAFIYTYIYITIVSCVETVWKHHCVLQWPLSAELLRASFLVDHITLCLIRDVTLDELGDVDSDVDEFSITE